ncbi:MAG: ATP-binding protein [archaeon]|nr:ATP-binding protein [archaeon]
MPADKEEIAKLYREGSSKSQDIYPVENATLDDLNLNKVKAYLKESRLAGQLDNAHFYNLLKKENFVAEIDDRLVPTIAGIVLFGKHPQINLPFTTILADRYLGVDMISWIDKREVNGTLFELIDQVEKFFLKNMKTAAWSEGFRTEHKTEYPITALKEAVINALVHRDYHEKENIMIRMFDNRIEIISPGELLRPLTIENLKKLDYKPKSRNKTLVDVLLRRKLMDKRGSGILRMKQAMNGWDLPNPEYKEDSGYFVIKFTGPYQKTTIKILEELNERQRIIINYLSLNKTVTNRQYCSVCKTDRVTAFRDLKELEKKGIILRKSKGRSLYYVFHEANIEANNEANIDKELDKDVW